MYLLALIILLLTAPAYAQSGDEYQTCLDTAEGQQAMVECQYTESERLDKELERAYLDMMTRALDQDQLEQKMPSGDVKDFTNVLFLQKSQDAWKDYMANECDRRRALFGNGSGAGLEHTGCLVQLKTQRLNELKSH